METAEGRRKIYIESVIHEWSTTSIYVVAVARTSFVVSEIDKINLMT